MAVKTLKAKIALALLVLAASPIAAFASDVGDKETIWDWMVRLLQWTAGGWHHY
jgi:hypothetical protein